jgi:hypothetical protein
MKRLLILSCSARKKNTAEPLLAIDRYDGPAFFVLRKYLRNPQGCAPKVMILSAKYGLICSSSRIDFYDSKLTRSGAQELRPRVLEILKGVFESESWDTVGICSSKIYQIALQGIEEILPKKSTVDVVGGGLGLRLANLHAWLRNANPTKGEWNMAIQSGLVFTQLQAVLASYNQPISGDLLVACDSTVDQLLEQTTECARPGMLLGKIQSGKTRAFIGVLALAFDNGFDHAVIFTKGTKALAKQTYVRLRRDLRLAIEHELVSIHDIMNLPGNFTPYELSRKLIVVCKKEDDNLNALNSFLTQEYPDLASKKNPHHRRWGWPSKCWLSS